MSHPIQPPTTNPLASNPLSSLFWQSVSLFVPLTVAMVCVALSPQTRAACREGCGGTNSNTYLGDSALVNNTAGVDNTATGYYALYHNISGNLNTATGSDALFNNSTGGGNTATGYWALVSNATGDNNTANGNSALQLNSTWLVQHGHRSRGALS